MKKTLKLRVAGVLLAALALHAGAQVDDFPRKAVTLVVPYPAGGGTDVVARTLAEQMTKALGQPVIIDNKPGASGILGTNAVAKSVADGYTMVIGLNQSLLTNQFLYKKLPYDPRRELALVTQIATAPLLLLVPASSRAQSVGDLRRELDAGAGAGNCGSWGAGSYPHLACAHMASSWKADITHVAYKGEAPMMQDLAGGQLSFAFGSVISAKAYLDAGKLRALAIAGEQRLPVLASVPTFTEAGFDDPEFRVSGWIALAVPAGTPQPIVVRLQHAAQQSIASPELAKRFQALGMVAIGNSAEQFRTNYAADWPIWEHLVNVSGARLD